MATTDADMATAMTSAAAVASAAAATARHLCEAGGAVFPVEEVECGKTDVSHFLFAENEALVGAGTRKLPDVGVRKSGCRRASHERKTEASGAKCR
jgi:hypothetical protein